MKIIHYLNLIVTVLHSLLLLTSGISALFKDEELFFYAAYSHFAFGCLQMLISLGCLFFIKKMEIKSRNYLLKYYGIVIIYFLIMYAFSNFNFSNEEVIMISYIVIIPMCIAYYLVFTTRNIMHSVTRK